MNGSDLKVGVGSGVAEGHALLNKRTVARRLGVCLRTLERLISNGVFPRGLSIAGCLRWEPSDVERFIEQARAARDVGVSA
jgi:predicted DNA-binding transcriptional regulator AlpA